MVYDPSADGSLEDAAANDVGSPYLRGLTLRTETQARVDRIAADLTAHVEALRRAGALDSELASELAAKIKGVCDATS